MQNENKKHIVIRLIDHRERWQQLSLKHKIIVGAIAVFVVLGASALAYSLLAGNSDSSIDISKNTIPPKPTTVASPLTGVQVAPALAKRPVTGVMIENSQAARPQSGLTDAGIVFEAIAEGGITRFVALFQEARPQYIGPVRSLRPYYIDFAWPFQASIAHAGGSPEALKEIRSGRYRDLDEFFNGNYYWRVSTRAAPHNLYTSFHNLDALNKVKGYKSSSFKPWPRKAEAKTNSPSVTSMNFILSGPLYNPSFSYDTKANWYLRSEGGQPHMSTSNQNGGGAKQIHPKVVIALVMPRSVIDSAGHSDYVTSGKGIAYVFQDGTVTKGTWIKTDRSGQLKLVDSKGKIIKLNAGQNWVTVVASSSDVSYSGPPHKSQ